MRPPHDGWDQAFGWLGGEGVQALDRLTEAVFFPVPDVLVSDEPVWKNVHVSTGDVLYFFKLVKPDDKTGWYLSAELSANFTVLNKDTFFI